MPCSNPQLRPFPMGMISINGVQSTREHSAVISTVPSPRLTPSEPHWRQYSRQLYPVGYHLRAPIWTREQDRTQVQQPRWEALPMPIHGGQRYANLLLHM